MASSINASTTSGIVQTADTSGILNLQSNGTTVASVSSTGVAVTGNITASGATGGIGYGPAFSAYGTALQSLASATYTKIAFNTEAFDTANCYDSTTNYRFTPNVAGYYQVNAATSLGPAVATAIQVTSIWKNGANALFSGASLNSVNTSYGIVSGLLYLNGSTDYVEAYIYQSSGGALNCGSNSSAISFSACLVRSA